MGSTGPGQGGEVGEVRLSLWQMLIAIEEGVSWTTASRGEHFRIEGFLVLFGFCAWNHAAAKTLISCSHFPDESQHVNRTVQVLGWMNQHQTLGNMFGYSALAPQRRSRAEPDQEF